MIALDRPPTSISHSEDYGDFCRCSLCCKLRPAEEMVPINTAIAWCTDCALRHPELVPPPQGVMWPVAGFLLGGVLGALVGTALVMAAGIAITALWGSLIGLSAGLAIWAIRASRSALP